MRSSVHTSATTKLRLDVKQANPGGKAFVITFKELRHDENTSIAKVKVASGGCFGSVGSAMFIPRRGTSRISASEVHRFPGLL